MTAPTEPHLIEVVTDRGFTHLPPIDGTYDGHQVKVYESSAATRACLWLNAKDGEHITTVHMTVENALRLADQIQHLARHHYQLADAAPSTPEEPTERQAIEDAAREQAREVCP